MKMMPPEVISHENQLQHLSEPSIFMLDVFRTGDHAGQIFIPHRAETLWPVSAHAVAETGPVEHSMCRGPWHNYIRPRVVVGWGTTRYTRQRYFRYGPYKSACYNRTTYVENDRL